MDPCCSSSSNPNQALYRASRRWGSGFFSGGTLGLNAQNTAVSMPPWRLAIAGDYLRGDAQGAGGALLSGAAAADAVLGMLLRQPEQ